jgi:hypothetical protein
MTRGSAVFLPHKNPLDLDVSTVPMLSNVLSTILRISKITELIDFEALPDGLVCFWKNRRISKLTQTRSDFRSRCRRHNDDADLVHDCLTD